MSSGIGSLGLGSSGLGSSGPVSSGVGRRYAALTFASALLLFLVQPLTARHVLPWFGGAASVWTTCLLFYQALLFVGYGYAHLGRRLGPHRQATLHVALLAGTLALLPVVPSPAWRPTGAEVPAARLLGLLTVTIGGPYLLLAGTTPLLHDWFGLVGRGRSPYRLYATSNAGSLAALLVYPTFVEPLLGVRLQAVTWSWAYAAFAVAFSALAWSFVREARGSAAPVAPARPLGTAAPPIRDVVHWLMLSACGSGLLLAVTNTITMDVASVPLLWIVPLATYLSTFVVAFGGRYRRGTWGALLVLALGATALLWAGGFALPVVAQVALGLGVLLAGCMVCHGELASSAPAAPSLTLFYLTMAGGGALGGLTVALVAPALLTDFYELPVFALLAWVLLWVALRRDARPEASLARATLVALAIAGVLAAVTFAEIGRRRAAGTVAAVRNFYGVLRVQDDPPGVMGGMRVLRHGRIFHGARFLDEARRSEPTAYFTEGSGVALAIEGHPVRRAGASMRIGVVGLGVGTLAAWGRPGDSIRFHEIDPDAERIARGHFAFLDESPAEVEVVIGDGRLSLERALAAAGGGPLYDVLVVDAFAGDAVPVHLLTHEAAELYRRAVGPEGVIVFQITNRHVDLERVVRGLAHALGLRARRFDHAPPEGSGGTPSSWMLVAAEGVPLPAERTDRTRPGDRSAVLWTDDYSNLLRVLR